MSRRSIDMHAESALADFLDKYFYSRLLDEGLFSSIERIQDIDMQKSRVDVCASYRGSTIYIDEKAQLYYINKNLPTFAFELEYLHQGTLRLGWLLKETLLTTHYCLLWPSATTTRFAELRMTDFTEIDGLIIQKNKLLQYLANQGLDSRTLRTVAKLVLEKRVVGRQSIPQDGMYLYASDSRQYSEAPINLVIRKSLLMRLSDMQYRITPGGFQRLK